MREREEEGENGVQENGADLNDMVVVVEAHPSSFYGVVKRGDADGLVIGEEGDEVIGADCVEGRESKVSTRDRRLRHDQNARRLWPRLT